MGKRGMEFDRVFLTRNEKVQGKACQDIAINFHLMK